MPSQTVMLSQTLTPESVHYIIADIEPKELITKTLPGIYHATPFSSYTYLYVQVQSTQNSQGLDIYIDPGTRQSIINHK